MSSPEYQINEVDSSCRDAGLFFSDHLTDEDIIEVAAQRGLAVGVLGSRALQVAQSWLGDQYELNAAALRDLGFQNDDKVGLPPALDEVIDGFGMTGLFALDRRHRMGFLDNLVICPSMQQVGLMGTEDEPGYIPRFDRKQGKSTKTTVLTSVWEQIGDKEETHDVYDLEGWNIAVVLDSGSDLRAPSMNGDAPRGLLYTGMTAEDQRAILQTDKEDFDLESYLELDSATLAQIIVVNAQRRLRGDPLLDDTHWHTRLPQYADVKVKSMSYTPSVGTDGTQLNLGGSNPKKGFPGAGIREAIHVIENPDTSDEVVSDEAG